MSKLLHIGTALPDAPNRFTLPRDLVPPVEEDASDPESLADIPPPAFSQPISRRAPRRSSMNVRYTKRAASTRAWLMA